MDAMGKENASVVECDGALNDGLGLVEGWVVFIRAVVEEMMRRRSKLVIKRDRMASHVVFDFWITSVSREPGRLC